MSRVQTPVCPVTTKSVRARPGIEPGTSRTRSANHTPRPTSRCSRILEKIVFWNSGPCGTGTGSWVTELSEWLDTVSNSHMYLNDFNCIINLTTFHARFISKMLFWKYFPSILSQTSISISDTVSFPSRPFVGKGFLTLISISPQNKIYAWMLEN